jgi:hypothetical protein
MRRTTSPARAPGSAAAAAAALGIYHRRRSYTSDQHLDEFPNPDDLDRLYAAAAYVDKHSDVVASVLGPDIRDQIVLINYLHVALDRMMLRALNRARARCRTPWTALAEALGLASYQGAQNLHLRLMNAFAIGGTGRRSEVDARAAGLGRPGRAAPNPPAAETSAQEVAELAEAFVAAYRTVPEDLWEELLSVREALTPDATRAALKWLLAGLEPRRAVLPEPLAALVTRALASLA